MQLVQVVKSVTRPASSTCLDHVYTSHEHLISHLSVPNIGLANRLPVFICRKYTKKSKETNNIKIKYRGMKNTCFSHDNINNILNFSTLGISGWGCAAGTLEPLAYTRASFSWILLPFTRVNSPNHSYPRVAVFQKLRSLVQSKAKPKQNLIPQSLLS